jgi:hypothetical protein
LRDLKLAFGIGTDKASVLLDRPTTIVGHNIDLAIDRAIAALEAEVVADAEVVEPEPSPPAAETV